MCVWCGVMIVKTDCGSGPSGAVLLRGLALFKLILLSSVLQASRALRTLSIQPVDTVCSCLHRGMFAPKETGTFAFSNTDKHTEHVGVTFK